MAIIVESENTNEDFEIKHDKKYGFYKDYSKYIYKNENITSKISEKKQHSSK